jgi:hypothetical protein
LSIEGELPGEVVEPTLPSGQRVLFAQQHWLAIPFPIDFVGWVSLPVQVVFKVHHLNLQTLAIEDELFWCAGPVEDQSATRTGKVWLDGYRWLPRGRALLLPSSIPGTYQSLAEDGTPGVVVSAVPPSQRIQYQPLTPALPGGEVRQEWYSGAPDQETSSRVLLASVAEPLLLRHRAAPALRFSLDRIRPSTSGGYQLLSVVEDLELSGVLAWRGFADRGEQRLAVVLRGSEALCIDVESRSLLWRDALDADEGAGHRLVQRRRDREQAHLTGRPSPTRWWLRSCDDGALLDQIQVRRRPLTHVRLADVAGDSEREPVAAWDGTVVALGPPDPEDDRLFRDFRRVAEEASARP